MPSPKFLKILQRIGLNHGNAHVKLFQWYIFGLGAISKSLSLIWPIFHFPIIFLIILSHNLFSNVHVHMCIFRPIELFYHDWVLQLSHSPMVGCNSLYGSNFDFCMTYLASWHPRRKLRQLWAKLWGWFEESPPFTGGDYSKSTLYCFIMYNCVVAQKTIIIF